MGKGRFTRFFVPPRPGKKGRPAHPFVKGHLEYQKSLFVAVSGERVTKTREDKESIHAMDSMDLRQVTENCIDTSSQPGGANFLNYRGIFMIVQR